MKEIIIFSRQRVPANEFVKDLQSQGEIFHSSSDGKALTEDLQTMCETISDSS